MNVSALFVRRPVATSLLTMAIALAGALAFRLLPVAPLPQVEFPTIQVAASLPGASPETMASAVAMPLERQFGRIAGVTEMTSSSGLGATTVILQFDLARDIDDARCGPLYVMPAVTFLHTRGRRRQVEVQMRLPHRDVMHHGDAPRAGCVQRPAAPPPQCDRAPARDPCLTGHVALRSP